MFSHLNHAEGVYIINAKHCISSRQKREYLAFGEYIIKPQEDTRWRVMRYSPRGADDIRMYISPQARYTFNDIPNLRFG